MAGFSELTHMGPIPIPVTTGGLGGGSMVVWAPGEEIPSIAQGWTGGGYGEVYGPPPITKPKNGDKVEPSAGDDIWDLLQGIMGGAGFGTSTAAVASMLGLGTAGVGLAALLGSRIKAPWQTPAGEGWIAPWTGQQQVTDPVTGEVYWGQKGKEYFTPTGIVPGGAMPGGGKYWTNASRDGQVPATVEFIQTPDGYITSRSLIDGTVKRWKPKKHIVISNNPRMSHMRKLDRVHKKMTKMVRKYAPPARRSQQAPSAFLSKAERKLLAQGITS